MRLFKHLLALCATAVAAATSELTDTTAVYLQSVDSSAVTLLAEIEYNPSTLVAEIKEYEAPGLATDSKLLRVGVYDKVTSSWKSSTSVTSIESFGKGYAPTITLSLDTQGDVFSVSLKSGKIDAGQTRDFGPKVKVVKTVPGKKVELNKPVVLSKEGKVEGEVVEKTFLQKLVYPLSLLQSIVCMLTNSQVLVGYIRCHGAGSHIRRRRRQIDLVQYTLDFLQ
jgi:hypothetical protein